MWAGDPAPDDTDLALARAEGAALLPCTLSTVHVRHPLTQVKLKGEMMGGNTP